MTRKRHGVTASDLQTVSGCDQLVVGSNALKHRANWNTVSGAVRDLPWQNIRCSDNPVEVLNEQ